ncbi:MAG: FAD-dependent oxidoreductase [Bdellovibrionales bacterium]
MKMENDSIWSVTSGSTNQYGSLKGEISADVAIVGGGISGLTCAYFLAQAGQKGW